MGSDVVDVDEAVVGREENAWYTVLNQMARGLQVLLRGLPTNLGTLLIMCTGGVKITVDGG